MMWQRIKSRSIFTVIALILILVAVIWFVVEKRSTTTENAVAEEAAITNDPSQWEQPESSLSVSDQGEGSVTLTAEYIKEKSNDKILTLKIYLNTHSVDLSSVSFSKDIYLEKESKKIYPSSAVNKGEGHHRSSELTFEKVNFPVTIVGENIGGVARREVQIDL